MLLVRLPDARGALPRDVLAAGPHLAKLLLEALDLPRKPAGVRIEITLDSSPIARERSARSQRRGRLLGLTPGAGSAHAFDVLGGEEVAPARSVFHPSGHELGAELQRPDAALR